MKDKNLKKRKRKITNNINKSLPKHKIKGDYYLQDIENLKRDIKRLKRNDDFETNGEYFLF